MFVVWTLFFFPIHLQQPGLMISADVSEVALAVTQSLEHTLVDARLPDEFFCPICMLVYRGLLQGRPVILTVQTRHHALLDSFMRIVSIDLTEREDDLLRERLLHTIEHCECKEGHEYRLRTHDHRHVDEPRDLLRSVACDALCNCLYGYDSATNATPTVITRAFHYGKRFRSSTGAWPMEVEQLFPYGAERTVKGIVACCCSLVNRGPLFLLRAILDLARPRVWEIILQPDVHRRLCWAISTTILLGIPGGWQGVSRDPGCRPPDCIVPRRWHEAEWLRDGQGFRAACALLETIRTGSYALPDDGLRFSGEHLEMLRDVFRYAMSYYAETERRACKTLRNYLIAWERRATMRSAVSMDSLSETILDDPSSHGVLRMIRFALNWQMFDRRCGAPGCARTMLDRADEDFKPLAACARCTFVLYCGRECQRAAWVAGEPLPHKQICPVLAQLRATANASGSEELFIFAVQESDISNEHLALAGRWALSMGESLQDSLRAAILSESPSPSNSPILM